MTTIDRDELLNQARREREGLGRTVQYANPALWDSPSPCAGWRARDVLAHLAADDAGAAAIIAGEPWPELDEYRSTLADQPFDDDEFNNALVAKRADLPLRQIVSAWGHAADQILIHAAKIPADEWDTKTVEWFGSKLPAGDFLQTIVADWWTHGEDIRASVELPPRAEHWPIWILNDIAIRTLPANIAATGRPYVHKSVHVRLEGVGGGSWHQSLTPDEIAWERGADVSIEGNAHAFALVAARRISADVYLGSGELIIGGDETIGFDILENIQPW